MPTYDDNQIASRAIARFQRVSARKARLVADLVRGKAVGEALRIARFANRPSAAPMVLNVLKSAVANADTQEADVENLFVSKSFCDDGPIMKRFQPKDRGKSFSIFKRMCHITIEVEEGQAPLSKAKRAQLERRRARLAKKGKKETVAAAATESKPESTEEAK